MQIADFFDTEYTAYANYDSFRSIGSFVDGLKPTARKLICTVERNNIKEPAKLSTLVNKMSEEMEYLHGPVAAEGVAVGLAQNFVGSNNINLLKPAGSFGTRTITRAAASRYIKTCKEPIFDKLFNPQDKAVLIEQEFEGTRIEPRFYIPIVPMLLVNGNSGIGNGFAQKILSRNINEIIEKIEAHLRGGAKRQDAKILLPYFNGFKGRVKKTDVSSYEIHGRFDRTNTTTITVDELPVGYDLEKYNAILAKLEEDKVIQDYTDKSHENKFLFEIKVTREFSKKDDEWILQKLKLISRVTENFTCIGANNEIVEYKDEIAILNDFIKLRLEYYEKRKQYQIAKIKKELLILGAKYYFVKAILEDTITVNKQTKASIEQQILGIKGFPFKDFESLEFLLNMPIYSLSKEKFEELRSDIDLKKKELQIVVDTTVETIWGRELDELKKFLAKEFPTK